MVLLSITGLFRTLLIIIGVFIIMRFIGRLMIAKRNVDEHNALNRKIRQNESELEEAKKNFGKTTISRINKNVADDEYTDYTEVE